MKPTDISYPMMQNGTEKKRIENPLKNVWNFFATKLNLPTEIIEGYENREKTQ